MLKKVLKVLYTGKENDSNLFESAFFAIENDLAVSIFNSNMELIYASRKFKEIFCLDNKIIEGKIRFDNIEQCGNALCENIDRKIEAIFSGKNFQEIIICKNCKNTKLHLASQYNPIIKNQIVTGFVFQVEDITSQQLISHHYASLYRAIYSSLPIMEITIAGTIANVSDEYLRITGFHQNELLGKSYFDFTPEEDEDNLIPGETWQDISTGLETKKIIRRKAADGKYVWLSATYLPTYDIDGNINFIIKSMQHVTSEHLERRHQRRLRLSLFHVANEQKKFLRETKSLLSLSENSIQKILSQINDTKFTCKNNSLKMDAIKSISNDLTNIVGDFHIALSKQRGVDNLTDSLLHSLPTKISRVLEQFEFIHRVSKEWEKDIHENIVNIENQVKEINEKIKEVSNKSERSLFNKILR